MSTNQEHVSPPVGDGVATGLGDAFTINLNTGQGMFTQRIALPDGVAGHTPKLALEYASAHRHGPFGWGWRVNLRRVERRRDSFFESGQELLPLTDGFYGPRIEKAFDRYEQGADGSWIIHQRNGHKYILGGDAGSRLSDADDPDRIHAWYLSTMTDTSGNEIRYGYQKDGHLPYLSTIEYATYRVVFDYEEREDSRYVAYPGFRAQRRWRCRAIRLELRQDSDFIPLKTWALRYDYSEVGRVSLLSALQLTGHGETAERDIAMPATTFTYGSDRPAARLFTEVTPADGYSAPPPMTDSTANLVTLEGAPLPGILTNTNGAQYYWANDGTGGWRSPRRVAETPLVDDFVSAGAFFLDADGSGRPDLLVAGPHPLHGYYENTGQDGWGDFRAYPRSARATPNWQSAIAFEDFNSDGLIDVLEDHGRSFAAWRNEGDAGWATPTLAAKTETELRSVNLSEATTRLADMTGDGNRDLVRIRSGRIEYWAGLGEGHFGERVILMNSPRLPELSERPEQVFLLDLNRTGCTDLVVLRRDSVEVYFNQNGVAFSEPQIIEGLFPPVSGSVRAVDFMGTGTMGLLYNTAGGKYIYQPLGTDVSALMLTGTNNGFGLQSELDYRAAVTDYLRDRTEDQAWTTHFPFPHAVIAETRERDTITGHQTRTSYQYHDAHFETRLRQFRGFGRVDRVEHGDASRPDRRTVHHFYTGEELRPGAREADAALNGLLRRKEIFRATATRPTEVETATYELTPLPVTVDGTPRHFVAVGESRADRHDETDDISTVTTRYAYDQWGNVSRETKTGSGTRDGAPVPEIVVDTSLSYAVNENLWIVDRIATKVQRNGNGELLAEARNYYDGDDFTGLPLGQVTRGLRTRQEVFVLDGPRFTNHYQGEDLAALGYSIQADAEGNPAAFIQQERYGYDARGLRIASQNALGHEERFTFDPSGLFRTGYTTALGTTAYTYDPVRGRTTQIDNVDGTQLRLSYDAMDRIVDVFLPGNDSTVPNRTYTYDGSSLPIKRHTRHLLSDDGQEETSIHTYFDGRLQEVQKRVEQEAGTFIVSGYQEKNPFGDIKAEYEPFIAGTADFSLPDLTTATAQRFSFDVGGRPVRTENFFGGVSTAAYTPFTITTRDPIANDSSPATPPEQRNLAKIETINPFNHRIRTERELEGGDRLTIDYRLTELGQLMSIDDQHGRLADYLYDRLGNRLMVDHREAGRRRVRYDADRKPVHGVDANGNVITSDYDAATPRLLRLHHNGTPVEEYTYAHPAGKLTRVSYQGGSQQMDYDTAGRLQRKEYLADGQATPDTIAYTFDRIGRRTEFVHTDGTRSTYQLYGNGWVRGISGVVDRIDYDAFGNPTRLQYANGVVTERSYGPGGRKMVTQTTRRGSTVLEDVSFAYDVAGNLTRATDNTTGAPVATDYSYDTLEQLTATASGGNTQNYAYDPNDRLNLATIADNSFDLRYQNAARPQRLTEIVDGAAITAMNYDANGNLLNLPGRTFSYNFKNELVGCRRDDGLEADYFYDHAGQRVRKEVRDGALSFSTRFVEDQVEYRNGVATYFFTVGKVRLGVLSNGQMRFVHSNYLGNSGFFTDAAGTRIEAIAYTPFGNPSPGGGGSSNLAAFATQPYDVESGLYYMQRRYYAPEIGRFTSADLVAVYLPLEVAGDPVALHVYAYAGNNPTNNVDLEGTSFWSIVGGIVGAIVGVAAAIFLGPIGAIILGIGLVAASYFLADANVGNDFGEFMRGFMIGFNAGMNLVFATALFGPLIGGALGVINFLAVEESLTTNPLFEGVLGWSSWLMPMSWLVTGVGLIFFVINLILAGVTFQQVPALAITSINVDWRRGMINMEGGAIRAAGAGTAFNMGNFSFYDPGSLGIAEHEIGHGLNLAAFGWAFHYIGAIDQAADPNFGRGGGVYAEDLAEGSMQGRPRWPIRPGLDMWES